MATVEWKKRDTVFAIIIGELVAWLFFYLLMQTGADKAMGLKDIGWILAFFMPAACLSCLYISYLAGKKNRIFFEGGKFVAVGILNTLIDFSVLNFLSWEFSVTSGKWIILFNTISFLCAVNNSFFWNKRWTFLTDKSSKRKYFQFLTVTAIGWMINTATVYIGSTFLNLSDADPIIWLNIVKSISVLFSLVWDFCGYKFIVFKKTEHV